MEALLRFRPGPARGTLLLSAFLLLLACGGCRQEFSEPRLVVLYATCTLNKQFLSPYNPEVRFTPHLEAFAREGVVFERQMTEAGQSGIAFASLFSGAQADVHGAYNHPTLLGAHLYQITEAYGQSGYDVFFWSGQRMGSYEFHYGQGVPRSNAFITRYQDIDLYTANEPRFDAILKRLQRDPEYKAFVLINNTLTHSPYHLYADEEKVAAFLDSHPDRAIDLDPAVESRLLEIYDERFLELQWNLEGEIEAGFPAGDVPRLASLLQLLYEVAVHHLDTQFGRFVDRIRAAGLEGESLVSFTADHGESMYRDNALFRWSHGLQLAPDVIQVPWILRGPGTGVEPGRYPGVTRSIDVYPTMAGLSGVPVPVEAPVEGVDLAPVLRGDAPEPDLTAWFHTTTLSARLLELHKDFPPVFARVPRDDVSLVWVGSRRGDLVAKKTFDGDRWSYSMFDWLRDPEEREDLFDAANPDHAAWAGELDAYKARLARRWRGASRSLEEEEVHKLRSLGYIR